MSTRARLEAGLAPEQRPAALALHRACHSRLQVGRRERIPGTWLGLK